MKEPKAESDWMKCVNSAKKTLGIPKNTYVIIQGKLLRETQKCYCAMGY